jgi:hypothetical protein
MIFNIINYILYLKKNTHSLQYVRNHFKNSEKTFTLSEDKSHIFRKSKIILENSILDIYKCPFLKIRNTFGKKKMLKIREKAETIKKIKVRPLKKVFQICDDKFFLRNYKNIILIKKYLGIFSVSIIHTDND